MRGASGAGQLDDGADVGRPRSASVIFLKQPKYDINVGCGRDLYVNLFDGSARLPDRGFFYLAGQAASAMSGRPSVSLDPVIGVCRERALPIPPPAI